MTGPAPKYRLSRRGFGVRPGRKPLDSGAAAERGWEPECLGFGTLTAMRPAPQAMKRGDVVDAPRAGGAARKRIGERHAESRQPVEDIRPRRGNEKPGLFDDREPDAHRGLAAAEAEPVGPALKIEVEAVVSRGLLQPGDRDGRQHYRPRPSVFRSHATRMLTKGGR